MIEKPESQELMRSSRSPVQIDSFRPDSATSLQIEKYSGFMSLFLHNRSLIANRFTHLMRRRQRFLSDKLMK